MKLTAPMVETAVDQLQCQAISEDNPLMGQLTQLFGDHTFFLASDGLHIVEPIDDTIEEEEEPTTGKVIKLASWTSAERTTLAAHKPEQTDMIVSFDKAA